MSDPAALQEPETEGAATSVAATLEAARRSVKPSVLAQKSVILRSLIRIQRERLTPMGLTMLGAFALGGFLGSATLHVPLYWVTVLLFAIVVVPAFAPKPRVSASRVIPTRSDAGSTLDYSVIVENQSSRSVYDFVINEVALPEPVEAALAHDLRQAGYEEDQDLVPARSIAVLGPGERVEIPMALRFPRRGYYRLDRLRAETIFPFGIWRRGEFQRSAVDDILVLPRYSPLEHLELPTGRRYQPGGISLISNVGESPEFIGVRDWRDGDSLRDIDWRSWARTGRPAVKEFQEEYFCRVALVVDTHLPEPSKAATELFEAAVSMAAAVAAQLADDERVVDLFAAGPKLYRLQAGRNLAFLENILEVLACLEETPEYPFSIVVPELMEEIAQIASVVFVLLDWDEHRARFVQAVHEGGSAVKVILVRDAPPSRPVSEVEALTGHPAVVLSAEDVALGPRVV